MTKVIFTPIEGICLSEGIQRKLFTMMRMSILTLERMLDQMHVQYSVGVSIKAMRQYNPSVSLVQTMTNFDRAEAVAFVHAAFDYKCNMGGSMPAMLSTFEATYCKTYRVPVNKAAGHSFYRVLGAIHQT